jgi:hypothetical protein
VSMLLVMTFNVWVILAVLGGHAAGYLVLATAFRNGVLPAAMLARITRAEAGGLSEGGLEIGGSGSGSGSDYSSSRAAQLLGKTPLGCGATPGGTCDCA